MVAFYHVSFTVTEKQSYKEWAPLQQSSHTSSAAGAKLRGSGLRQGTLSGVVGPKWHHPLWEAHCAMRQVGIAESRARPGAGGLQQGRRPHTLPWPRTFLAREGSGVVSSLHAEPKALSTIPRLLSLNHSEWVGIGHATRKTSCVPGLAWLAARKNLEDNG